MMRHTPLGVARIYDLGWIQVGNSRGKMLPAQISGNSLRHSPAFYAPTHYFLFFPVPFSAYSIELAYHLSTQYLLNSLLRPLAIRIAPLLTPPLIYLLIFAQLVSLMTDEYIGKRTPTYVISLHCLRDKYCQPDTDVNSSVTSNPRVFKTGGFIYSA